MRKYSTKKSKKAKRTALKKMTMSATFRICLIAIIALFGVLYLIETSTVSTRGYKISNLKEKVKKLEQENRRLEVKIAEHRSMKSILARLDKDEFVKARNINYVETVGTAVARK